jgi:hypothetical protein
VCVCVCVHVCVYINICIYIDETDEGNEEGNVRLPEEGTGPPGTQFTCFTSTTVQILTPEELRVRQCGQRGYGRGQGG